MPKIKTVLSFTDLGWVQYARIAKLPKSFGQRLLAQLKAWLMKGWEAKWAAKFHLCITVSGKDASLLTALSPAAQVAAIENGVDCTRLLALPRPHTFDILFTGVMGYPPNADAVEFFCQSILPRIQAVLPEARLIVVGHSPGDSIRSLSGKSVVVTGSVDDLLPYYEQCLVSVAPLRAGGGTRLKILEAMALGRPVVSTSIGFEGIEVTDGMEILAADSAEDFAQDVLRLFEDQVLWHSVAQRARIKVQSTYNWDQIAAKLHDRYIALCEFKAAAQGQR